MDAEGNLNIDEQKDIAELTSQNGYSVLIRLLRWRCDNLMAAATAIDLPANETLETFRYRRDVAAVQANCYRLFADELETIREQLRASRK